MPQHVYIIGAKGLGNYGGYETFVDKLTEYHENNPHIRYHIACKANGTGAMDEEKLHGVKTLDSEDFIYHNAYCHKVEIPAHIGPAQAVIYDCKAFEWAISDIKKNNIEHPIVYILACRIGLFINKYVKELHALGGRCYINPDGACEIMGSTGEKPVKSRLHGGSVFYPNSNTEYHIKNICSGILKRFCYIPMLLRQSGRAFFCWAFSKPLLFDPGIA